jgi:hypothetical protein
LVGDDDPILIHALPGSYPTLESVLLDAAEHVPVSAEDVDDSCQLIWSSVAEPYPVIGAAAFIVSLGRWFHMHGGMTDGL